MTRKKIGENSESASPFLWPSLLMAFVCASSGCGKVPTWSELTGGGQQPPPPPIIIPQQAPQVVTPTPTVTPEPPKATSAEVVAAFKKLEPYQVDDLRLEELSKLTEGLEEITEIKAAGSGLISNNAAISIAKLPAVKDVDLTGTKVDDNGVKALATCQSIQSLNLSTAKITDKGIEALIQAPNLRKLNLERCNITGAGYAAIGKMPLLEEIILNYTAGVNDATLDLICNARTLRSIHLRGCGDITDAGLIALAKLEVLEEINIGYSKVTGEGFLAVTKGGGLQNIKHLGMAQNPITAKGAQAINSMKSLEFLDLYHVAMDDVGFTKIASGLKKLKYLNINEVTMVTSFAALKGCNEIETIHAQQTNVNDLGLSQLKSHESLKLVDVGKTRVSESGVLALKKILKNCKIHRDGIEY